MGPTQPQPGLLGNLDRSERQCGTRQPGAYECATYRREAELREILDIPQVIKPEHELEILRKLQKLMPTAQALVEETRDKELGKVLTAVAAKVTL